MPVDVSKLQFYSGYPIDKITQQGTVSYTVAGSSSSSPDIVTQTIPNTFGKKGFINLSWSVDNLNYQDQQNQLFFISSFFGGEQLISFQAQAGSDDSTIYFYLQNGLLDGSGNPTSQTVTINYAVYSVS